MKRTATLTSAVILAATAVLAGCSHQPIITSADGSTPKQIVFNAQANAQKQAAWIAAHPGGGVQGEH